MSQPMTRSAREDWFAPEGPHLLGATCTTCGSIFFPPQIGFCRNPACDGENFDRTPLSRSGTVWSFTVNHYKPPAPYVSPEPFTPYTVVAVELHTEGMVVLGQLSPDSPRIAVGDRVHLVSEVLVRTDDEEQLVWRWALDQEGREVA
ncbi:Zn-ribbon domain-containing OB-fold protein [Rhodococcus sp. JVH1]|uniref:Zn-ribbon domain-containing OB-fold protein n=1 Tax=Rhodococcus sp. JVH1 TaxID=745408 RepID=UPI000271EB32|nr:OB-fold domain-containing protein [Rhodococcus sp. JVH1]EJI93548.1 hypothetical protein JVH1_9097 [Rhodococcus sp. JVH1]